MRGGSFSCSSLKRLIMRAGRLIAIGFFFLFAFTFLLYPHLILPRARILVLYFI